MASSTLHRLATSIIASLPKFAFDFDFVRSQAGTGVPSAVFTLVKDKELTVQIPGLKQTEDEEGVWFSFHLRGLHGLAKWSFGFEGFNFFFYLESTEKVYLASTKLPELFDPHADLKMKIENGVCSFCLLTQKTPDPFLAAANINRLLIRPTPYCQMFDRSDLGKRLCEVIAHPGVKSKSFTAYNKDDGETIYFKGNLPGVDKTVVTEEGLCVSLRMRGFELADVEVGFEYDALIVEGKRGCEHYIAGVRVPEGFRKENGVIMKEMKDGVFKATLPRV